DMRMAHSNCATPATISVAELAHELRIADKGPGDFHILDGYDRVLALLADGLDIRLGTAVTAIRWDQDGVEVWTSGGERAKGRRGELEPSPPLTFGARHAVVTLPLALLKAGAVAFDPPLPQTKRHAIDSLAMAPAMKLLLRFEQPFWDAEMTFLTGRDP